jgi:hypothetical protein
VINTVRWPADDRLHFLGRNGIGKCTGLEIFQHEDVVELQRITSKDGTGRCRLCIPTAAIPQIDQRPVSDAPFGAQPERRKYSSAYRERVAVCA